MDSSLASLCPREAVVSVTDTCDYQCRMCHIRSGPRLPIEVLRRLPTSLTRVTLTGGEPFLRGDIPSLVNAVHARCPNAKVTIVTNGGRPERIASQVKACTPTPAIRVSLDGVGPVHDLLRGVDGAYECAMRTLDLLKPLVPDLGISMTVCDLNAHTIPDMHTVARGLRVKFAVQVAHNGDLYYRTHSNTVLHHRKILDGIEVVRQRELRAWSPRSLGMAYYLTMLKDYVEGKPRRLFCDAGRTFIYVAANGDVYPCLMWPRQDKALGNLVSQTWDEMFVQDSTQSYRVQKILNTVRTCPVQCCLLCTVAPAVRRSAWKLALPLVWEKVYAHARHRARPQG